MRPFPTLLLSLLAAAASAEESPTYSGWTRQWQATFPGAAGTQINTDNWNIKTGANANNEWQRYTTSTSNMQLSGGQTLQIIPRKDAATGEWTSARIESVHTFTPTQGRITRAEAKIRFGANAQANKQGIWPAFWTLGDSIRHGTPWPQCGELDVMETVNGLPAAYGTIHCGVYPGGTCNEPSGVGQSVAYSQQEQTAEWTTWRIQWNREAANWQDEVVTWWKDGVKFHEVTGARIGDQSVWNSLTGSPLYFILNVAVGGDWPGAPNDSTLGGFGAMMEVAYVAQYVTN